MTQKEEIQKELKRDKEELNRVVNEFIKVNNEITRLRYCIDYLVIDEMNLKRNIKLNKEKLK